MHIILYRWRLKPEAEENFAEAWRVITDYYRSNCDSLGSRLHKRNDGLFYAYAQWKSLEDFEMASLPPEMSATRKAMADSIDERLPEIVLKEIADFLI